jgi:hypothetical protein
LSCNALANLPVVQVAVPVTVPLRPQGEESLAVVPVVSSSFQYASSPESWAISVGQSRRL